MMLRNLGLRNMELGNFHYDWFKYLIDRSGWLCIFFQIAYLF